LQLTLGYLLLQHCLDLVLKYYLVLYPVAIVLTSKLQTISFEVWNAFLFFFPWCCLIQFLRMFSLSVIPFQLLHIKCDNDEHMFQRPSTFFWCNSEDSPPPCLDISSITLTPRSSPDSRLPAGLLIPPPSKSGLPKPSSEYSCPRPRVILLCKSFLFFDFPVFFLSCVINMLKCHILYSDERTDQIYLWFSWNSLIQNLKRLALFSV